MIADKMVFVENRVFVSFHKNERGKHKSTSYTPYTRENTVSSTIITFLDKTNLRKQTSVHLLWDQATLIVEEKRSTKIDFNKFAKRLDFYIVRNRVVMNV